MSRLILVLGMHRSGTSIVTKSLECLGVSLGDRAEWYGDDNPSGFWEDLDVLALDEQVLARYGAEWHSPTVDLTRVAIVSDLAVLGQRILADRLKRFPLFGLKEPRMCRLLPFWRPIFERLGCEVSVVRVWRNPLDIAESLNKRNSIPIMDAWRLATEHLVAISENVDPTWQLAYTSFDAIRSWPQSEVRLIGQKLGLEADDVKLDWFAREFIRR